jgi:protein-S-isoprenylcysteine O-methyltransferase Ste14
MPLARKITKIAFGISTFLVLFSFWFRHQEYGFYQTSIGLRFCGLALTFISFLFLKKSLDQLGKNYSPIFDTHKPHQIVTAGSYRFIRHPVYLCNILIISGYVISSSSLWVLILSVWGWFYMIFSILKEEKYLAIEFPEYKNYQKDTWRIIPFVF